MSYWPGEIVNSGDLGAPPRNSDPGGTGWGSALESSFRNQPQCFRGNWFPRCHWRRRPSFDSQPGCCLIALKHFRNTDAWAPPQIHYTRISGGRAWELSSLEAPRQFWCVAWARLLARQLTYLGRNWRLTAHVKAVMFTDNLECLLKPHNNSMSMVWLSLFYSRKRPRLRKKLYD